MNTSVAALSAYVERATRVLMNTYTRQPVALVSGSGARVTDSDGREYVDLVAGIAVNVLGHAHPALQRAVTEQAGQLLHASNLYYTEPQIALAELLVGSAFESRVFFCNSGAEAVEGAIKLARKWGKQNRDGATGIVCARGAFHGRTLGALAATANTRYQQPFEPLPRGFVHVAYNDRAAIESAIDSTTCAVMLEPIEGESGVHPLDGGVLADIRRICDERDVLLILDEVQSGMGRTGDWWAHQRDGVTPDVMTVAKGLGGGVPIGAVLAAPRADVLTPGDHGSTFGGGPLACAAGIATMRTIVDENLIDNAVRMGDYLSESLLSLAPAAPIRGIRGRGLMLGVALSEEIAPRVATAALEHGVIVNAVGQRTLRLVPPLVLTRDDVDTAMRGLEAAFADVARSD